MSKTNRRVLQQKFDALASGEEVVMSDDEMSRMPDVLADLEADHWFKHARSSLNVDRVGVLDKYVVSMKPFKESTKKTPKLKAIDQESLKNGMSVNGRFGVLAHISDSEWGTATLAEGQARSSLRGVWLISNWDLRSKQDVEVFYSEEEAFQTWAAISLSYASSVGAA